MSNKVYSADGENRWGGDLSGAIEEAVDNQDDENPKEVQISSADRVDYKHSDFISGDMILELIRENAYDEIGEWEEDHLGDLMDNEAKVKEFEDLIVKFISDNSKALSCFKCVNIKEETHSVS